MPHMVCSSTFSRNLDKLKKDHPGKQFIIEKAAYESHDHMLDTLDEMGQQLEEKEAEAMELKKQGNSEFTDVTSYEDLYIEDNFIDDF